LAEALAHEGGRPLAERFSFGGLLISALWVVLGSTYGLSWRWMYLSAALPLVIVLLGRKLIPESERRTSTRRSSTTIQDLLRVPVRRNFLGALVVSVAITGGWWAVSSFLPSFVGSLVHDPKRVAFYTGWAGALYNAGEIVGCIALGFVADRWGRKATIQVYFIGCLVIVPIVFLTVHGPATATGCS
jgi:MFS family permease